jgi:hypothetical protein
MELKMLLKKAIAEDDTENAKEIVKRLQDLIKTEGYKVYQLINR